MKNEPQNIRKTIEKHYLNKNYEAIYDLFVRKCRILYGRAVEFWSRYYMRMQFVNAITRYAERMTTKELKENGLYDFWKKYRFKMSADEIEYVIQGIEYFSE